MSVFGYLDHQTMPCKRVHSAGKSNENALDCQLSLSDTKTLGMCCKIGHKGRVNLIGLLHAEQMGQNKGMFKIRTPRLAQL